MMQFTEIKFVSNEIYISYLCYLRNKTIDIYPIEYPTIKRNILFHIGIYNFLTEKHLSVFSANYLNRGKITSFK